MKRSEAEMRAAEEDLMRICPPGFANRYMRLERAVETVARGEEPVPFAQALCEAVGASIGTPAMSVAEIEAYAQDAAAVILETAIANRDYTVKSHGVGLTGGGLTGAL
jgi:hypothetical protein